jgi:hypothetical protein
MCGASLGICRQGGSPIHTGPRENLHAKSCPLLQLFPSYEGSLPQATGLTTWTCPFMLGSLITFLLGQFLLRSGSSHSAYQEVSGPHSATSASLFVEWEFSSPKGPYFPSCRL